MEKVTFVDCPPLPLEPGLRPGLEGYVGGCSSNFWLVN